MRRLAPFMCVCALGLACESNSTPGLPGAPSAPSSAARPTPSGPAIIPGTPISPGQTVAATVRLEDPNCFYNWDASGVCRQFDLTVPRDGTLRISLTWAGPTRGISDPDLFLVSADGSWLLADGAWPVRRVTSPGTIGSSYRIVVLSYAQALDFEVAVDLEP